MAAKIITLSSYDADHAFYFKDALYIAEGHLYTDGDDLILTSQKNSEEIRILTDGGMETKTICFHKSGISVEIKQSSRRADGAEGYVFVLTGVNAAVNDVFLRIHFSGNTAELYQNGRKISDWFYTGLPYEVGLKRFLPVDSFELWITPLHQNTDIYLEIPPDYTDGMACALNHVEIEVESIAYLEPYHRCRAFE